MAALANLARQFPKHKSTFEVSPDDPGSKLLNAWLTLPAERQQEVSEAVATEAKHKVIRFHPLLKDAAFLSEARPLAKALGLRLSDFTALIDPGCPSPSAIDTAFASVQRVPGNGLMVAMRARMDLRHELNGGSYRVYTALGSIDIAGGNSAFKKVEPGHGMHILGFVQDVLVHGEAGTTIIYAPFPLTAWIVANAEKAVDRG